MGAGGRRDNDLDLPQHRGGRGACAVVCKADFPPLFELTTEFVVAIFGVGKCNTRQAVTERIQRWVVGHLAYRPDRVAVDEYIRAYSVPGAMKAGFEYYRAIPLTTQQNQEFKKTKLTMPVLAIGGVLGAGAMTIETMKLVADKVQGAIIEQCGHYTPEECPGPFSELVKAFLAE
jgi:pimeloyl-ACP methyl ester carboxylesterase